MKIKNFSLSIADDVGTFQPVRAIENIDVNGNAGVKATVEIKDIDWVELWKLEAASSRKA